MQTIRKKENMSMEDLNFSARVTSSLRRAGVKTLEQLLELSREELLRIRNMGTGSVDEIEKKLKVIYPNYVMKEKIGFSIANISYKGKVSSNLKEQLNFSAKVASVLNKEVRELDKLLELSREELLELPNMGKCGVAEIEEKLKMIYPDYVMKEKRVLSISKIYDAQKSGEASIDLLVFSTRVSRALKRAKVTTINQLLELSYRDLSKIRNLGEKSITEIEEKLKTIYPGYVMRDKRKSSTEDLDNVQEVDTLLVESLAFSTRVSRALKRAKITTIDQLLELSREELLRIRNIGTGCVDEIEEKLQKLYPGYVMKK